MVRYAIRFISGRYQGGVYPIPDEGELLIGRSSDLDVVLVEDMVSRKHAKIWSQSGELNITDLGSTNGTFVNGEKVRRSELTLNDRVLIGTSILRVVDGEECADQPQDTDSLKTMMKELGGRENEGSSMSGDLEEVPLPDLLQLFASNRKTGVLTISGANAGKVMIKDGQLVYASISNMSDISPMKALARMMIWSKGTFRLEPLESVADFDQTFDEPTESVLMEIMRQTDETKRMFHDLPEPETPLTLCMPLAPKLGDLSSDELDTLQLAINFPSIQAVLDKSPEVDFEALQRLHKLLRAGYLEPAE